MAFRVRKFRITTTSHRFSMFFFFFFSFSWAYVESRHAHMFLILFDAFLKDRHAHKSLDSLWSLGHRFNGIWIFDLRPFHLLAV
jgi:hypothetical protein